MSGETFDVFVGNLTENDSEADIRKIFEVVGDIHSVKLLPPKEGTSKSKAFVRFLRENDAKCAANYLNNHLLEDGRTLMVRYKSQEERRTNPSDQTNGNVYTNGSTHSNGYSSNDENPLKKSETEIKKTVLVVHIESPVSFYAQSVADEFIQKAQKVTTELEECCPTQPKVIGQLSSQQIYGCKFTEDEMWYRCSIGKCLPKNTVEVRYIDYGNSEVVDRFTLVTLPASLTKEPPLASLFEFEKLVLTDDDPSSSLFQTGVKKLKELISDKCLNLTVRNSDTKTFVKDVKVHEGAPLDVTGSLLSTGSVKIQELKGFTSPPAIGNTPFSTFRRLSSSSPTEMNGSLHHEKFTNGHHKNVSNGELQSLKMKLAQKEALEKTIAIEMKQLKSTLEKQTVNVSGLTDEITKLKLDADNNKPSISGRFAELLEKVKIIREQRCLVTVGEDVFCAEMQVIVDLFLKDENIVSLNSMSQYNDVQVEQENLNVQRELITKCDEKDELEDLLEERDEMIRKCVKSMRTFLKYVSVLPLQKREEKLIKSLEFLKNNHSELLEMNPSTEESLEKSVIYYKDEKSRKDGKVKKCREISNEKSSKLFKALGQFQRECHCIVSIKGSSDIADFDELMSEYTEAIKQEMKCTEEMIEEMKDSDKLKDVISSLNSMIITELADIKLLRSEDFQQKYKDLVESFKISLKNKPDTSLLLKSRKQIKQLKSKFRHKQADLIDIEEDSDETDDAEVVELEKELDEIRLQLHRQFVIEHNEIIQLADACKGNFPELVKMYPELALEEFIESNNLWQRSRTIDHYLQKSMVTLKTQPKQITYKCLFDGKPCVVKEISMSQTSNLRLSQVVQKIIDYTKEGRCNAIDIKCIFTDKSERKLYYQQDFISEGNIIEFIEKNNPDKKVIKSIFKDILESLTSTSKPYCALKPENVFVHKNEDGTFKGMMAEPSFLLPQEKLIVSCLNPTSKIENYPKLDLFINPPAAQADLICLAGMLLWAFHSTATFTDMVHNDIELLVTNFDLKKLLRQMLNPNPAERVTATEVRSHKYFNEEQSEEEQEKLTVNNKDGESDDTPDVSGLNLEDTLPISKADYESSDDVTLDVTATSVDERDEESSDDGKEITAWEKALAERSAKKKQMMEEKPVEEIPISDNDDF